MMTNWEILARTSLLNESESLAPRRSTLENKYKMELSRASENSHRSTARCAE